METDNQGVGILQQCTNNDMFVEYKIGVLKENQKSFFDFWMCDRTKRLLENKYLQRTLLIFTLKPTHLPFSD